MQIASVMSRSVERIDPNTMIREDDEVASARELMVEHQMRRLPVLNSDKRLVGVVALADLAHGAGEGAEAAKDALGGVTEPNPRTPRS